MLTLADFQRLAIDLKIYKAAPDGLWGPATRSAMDILTSEHTHVRGWSRERIIIAGIQLALSKLGYNPGEIDGYYGGLTAEAFNAWQYKKSHGKKEKLSQEVITPSRPSVFPLQRNVNKFYGNPNGQVPSRLVTIIPPYRMVLDWNLSEVVTKITLHELCVESANAALIEIFRFYGQDEINRLGLHRFAGSYNKRKMRGGSSWSMHAYGCAIDFFALPNGLRTRCPEALFCKPEYRAFFDIWEDHGWTSLGRAIGRDWMHVQAARL